MSPSVILGTVQFGLPYGINNSSGQVRNEEAIKVLLLAAEHGITTLDTAEVYGNAQKIIGDFHQHHAQRFLINTKFKGTENNTLLAECKKSLAELNISRIETYFFHSYQDYTNKPGLRSELSALKEQGLIRKTGLSIYTNEEFDTAINDSSIDTIQLPFNLLDNYNKRGALLNKAKQSGKCIQVRSVFLQGLFFKPTNELPDFLMPLKPWLEKLNSLAKAYQTSMETLCLQYAASQNLIDEIIIGVDSSEHLIRNLASLNERCNEQLLQEINNINVEETSLLYPFNWK